MAHTVKGRTKGYDNIKPGSAVSARERTIAGSLPPDRTARGNGENVKAGTAYGSARENIKVGTAAPTIERP